MPPMPNTSPTDIAYPLSANHTIHLTREEHYSRQVCHTWAVATIISYTPAALAVSKSILDLIRASFRGTINSEYRLPGHRIRILGPMLNWVWNNPIKAMAATIGANVLLTAAHLSQCLGDHLFTFRRAFYNYDGIDKGERFDLLIGALKIRHDIVLKNNKTDAADLFAASFPKYLFKAMPKCVERAEKKAMENFKVTLASQIESKLYRNKVLLELITAHIQKECNQLEAEEHSEL